MPTPLTLKVYRGDDLVRTEQFARDIIKIGRLSSAHLCLDDERVSRIHSVIEVGPDGTFSIIDMGSADGTYVNGKRVNRSPLRYGDQIALGGLRLVLEAPFSSDSPATAAASDMPNGTGAARQVAVLAGEVPLPGIDETTGAEPIPRASEPGAVLASPRAPVGSTVKSSSSSPAPATPPKPFPVPNQPGMGAGTGTGGTAAPDLAAAPASDRVVARKSSPRRGGRLSAAALAPRLREAEPEPAPPTEEPASGSDLGVELRMLWGDTLLDAGTFVKPSRPVLVGETKRCDFLLSGPDLPVPQFPILHYEEGEYRFLFARGMTGGVQEKGEVTTLATLVKERRATPDGAIDGAYATAVPRSGAARVEFGSGIRMEARFKRPPKPAVVPWWERINYQFLNLFLILLFLQAGFIVAANNFPYDTDTVADDLFKNPSRMAKFIIKPPEQQPKANPYLERLQKELKREEPGEMAERHKGTEGQMGKKDASKTNARSAPKAIDPNAKDIVKNSGLVALLGRGRGSSGGLSTIFGQGGLGGDLKGAIGNMFGPVVGDSYGLGGLGLKGTGTGGGGQGETIGIGGVGTKGRGGGLGSYGSGVGGLGKKSDRDVSISTGTAAVLGSIDKELIRRVIQEHASQIRYCYEQALAINPKLEGKVAIRWIINADGHVSNPQVDSGTTTLDNGSVHRCMMDRIASWEFPKPKGGGMAVVTYPWILRPSGGAGG
jgi:hypothetical protein